MGDKLVAVDRSGRRRSIAGFGQAYASDVVADPEALMVWVWLGAQWVALDVRGVDPQRVLSALEALGAARQQAEEALRLLGLLFTDRELTFLRFYRWLYRTGRLTESVTQSVV